MPLSENKDPWTAVHAPVASSPPALDPQSTLDARSSSSSTEPAAPAEIDVQRGVRVASHLLASQKSKEAQTLVEGLVQKHPRHPQLFTLLGEALKHQGDTYGAIAAFVKAHTFDVRHVESRIQLAALYHDRGSWQHSLQLVQEVNAIEPNNQSYRRTLALVMTDLGTLRKNEGKSAEGKIYYEEALKADPHYAPALYNLGVLAGEAAEYDEAIEYYRSAVEVDSHHSMAWGNLAMIYANRQEFQESRLCFQRAIQADPGRDLLLQSYARLLTVMASRCKEKGMTKEAISLNEEALAHDSACVEAMYNLGILFSEAGEKQRAVFMYETAIHYNSHLPELHNNLGVLYKDLGNDQKALTCYQNALSANPNFPMGYSNIGLVYAMQGRAEEAMEMLKAAIRVDSRYYEAYNNLGVLQKDSMASYEACLKISPGCRNPADNYLLGLNYISCGTCPEVSQHHLDWGEALSQRIPQLPPIDRTQKNLDLNRKLKVGYVSADLRTHSVSYFAEAPLSGHNSESIQHIAYNCCPLMDEKTELLKKGVHGSKGIWKDVWQLSEQSLADLIREDEIDILVELSGHTSGNRLGTLAMAPAPIQVTWIGYPNTTGLKQVDYRLTDAHCDPEDTTQIFSEELIRIPECFLCYIPFVDSPPVSPPPCLENGYITFGSFNNLAKITDEVIHVWSGILLALPEARFVLKSKTFACSTTRARFNHRFEREGIESWRIDLLPLSVHTKDHLSLYSLMDISLDPWPYAGTTTTCESLFMGVPCITMAGKCHAQNVGRSLIRTVGLDESWITRTPKGYHTTAIEKANDFAALAKMRRHLRLQMLSSDLCDARGHVARLETAYREMWHKWVKAVN